LQLESRAVWDEAADEWNIMRFELAGNRMRVRRPPSILTTAHETLFGSAPMADMRPLSQFAVAQSQADPSDPRYRPDNVAAFELEYLPGMAQQYASGAGKTPIGSTVRSVMDAPASAVVGAGKGGDGGAGGGDAPPAKHAPRDKERDRSSRDAAAAAAGAGRSKSGGSSSSGRRQ
jgi:hypothetical protein